MGATETETQSLSSRNVPQCPAVSSHVLPCPLMASHVPPADCSLPASPQQPASSDDTLLILPLALHCGPIQTHTMAVLCPSSAQRFARPAAERLRACSASGAHPDWPRAREPQKHTLTPSPPSMVHATPCPCEIATARGRGYSGLGKTTCNQASWYIVARRSRLLSLPTARLTFFSRLSLSSIADAVFPFSTPVTLYTDRQSFAELTSAWFSLQHQYRQTKRYRPTQFKGL